MGWSKCQAENSRPQHLQQHMSKLILLLLTLAGSCLWPRILQLRKCFLPGDRQQSWNEQLEADRPRHLATIILGILFPSLDMTKSSPLWCST
jgi:hypothetical protein